MNELKEFDIQSLFKSGRLPTIIMIGRKSAGKTTLITDILNNYKGICGNGGDIVCSDPNSYSTFRADPSIVVHNQYTPRIIENSLTRQKTVFRKQKAEIQEDSDANNPSLCDDVRTPSAILSGDTSVRAEFEDDLRVIQRRRVEDRGSLMRKEDSVNSFMVLDDCLYDNKWLSDSMMRQLFMNGFIWKTMLIISMSYPLAIPPIFQQNTTHIFIFSDNQSSYRRRCWEKYADVLPDFDVYCSMVDSLKKYECLVIQRFLTATIDNQIFLYKALLCNTGL